MSERKARTKSLIETGGLAAKAGLIDEFSTEEKFGAFVEIIERARKDASLRPAWAKKGARVLNPPPPPSKRAVEVQFSSRPASTDGLKALGLRYNGTRRCWEGIVDAEAAGTLAASLGGQFKLLDEPLAVLNEPITVPVASKPASKQ